MRDVPGANRFHLLFSRTNIDAPSVGLLAGRWILAGLAFRFAFEGSGVLLDSGWMDVFVAQPLYIEVGKAAFTFPVGHTPSGLVRGERISGVSLEPGGRELEFGTHYEAQVREDEDMLQTEAPHCPRGQTCSGIGNPILWLSGFALPFLETNAAGYER